MAKKGLWSGEVKETSTAELLPKGLFTESGKDIAEGLKKAVLESDRPVKSKYESAMSMLDFYINRAGKNLSADDRARLDQAKVELRKLFDRD